MANLKFDKEITALLVIDPYNDFISEGGKIWGRIKQVVRPGTPGRTVEETAMRKR